MMDDGWWMMAALAPLDFYWSWKSYEMNTMSPKTSQNVPKLPKMSYYVPKRPKTSQNGPKRSNASHNVTKQRKISQNVTKHPKNVLKHLQT